MNKLFTKIVGAFLGLTMAVGVGVVAASNSKEATPVYAADTTYTFTSKSWADSTSSWTSDNDGGQLTNGQGVQVTTTYSGAGAHTKSAINNITAIEFTYCTNSTKGVGSISVTIGSNDAVTYSVTKTGGTTARTTSQTYSTAQSGVVTFSVTCTQNSIYVAAIKITTQNTIPTTSVDVSPATVTLAPGETQQLTTTVLPANTTDTLSYSSNANNVATVSSSGLITAHADGTATITATSGNYSDTCVVTVETPTTPFITPDKTSTSGYTGQNESISFTYGNLDSSLSVVSNDTNVVTVGTPSLNAGSGTVQLNYVGAGTNIDVDFKDGSTTMATIKVSVTKTAFTTSPAASATIKTGKTTTLTAVLNSGGVINWESDDESVATVNNGVVTGVAAGTATITAISNDDESVYAESEITVVVGPAYESGFETADGFTASTTYNNSEAYEEGLTGEKWSIVCGHATSTAAAVKSGSMGMHLRYYTNVDVTPCMEMTWDVTDGHEMTFYAKGTASVSLKVEYSTDSGANWTVLLANESVTSSFSLITATIPSYTASARFRILSLSTTDKSGIYIDDLAITTMAEPTDPTITITSKDGSGAMSGVLGDIQEVTYETAHDDGLTLNWVLTDTESVVDWEEPYVEFLAVGADATLTAQLLDGNEDVVAYDTVTFHTLVPSLDVKVNGTSRANYALYADDSITVTATQTNKPESATISWTTDDTGEVYSTFNTSTGLFEAKAAGSVHLVVEMMYKGNPIVSDFLNVTISALSEPTLVISTGTGKTSYKFGEELDTTGWTATYTDNHGVAHDDVLGDLEFDSLDFIGTKAIKATYLGATSNTVNITVTNNGATCDTEAILEGSGFTSSSMPTDWSQSGGGAYAAGNAPYLLKFDGDGDKITATVNTSASTIYASLDVKMIGGGNTSSFAVTAKDSSGNSVATGTLTISGAQNDIVNPTATLSNPNGKTITSIEFVFTKGSNVGISAGSISVNNAASFASRQALAWARYFLEQTDGYCSADISSSVKTNIVNEYNWMIAESKAAFKDADIVRGKGSSYDDDLSEALSRYVNMIEEKGYNDADFLNLGSEVINKASAASALGNNSNATLILIAVSMISATALGGYFFLRKRKEQ